MPAYNKVGNVIFFHQYAESPEAIDTTVEKTSFPFSYAPLITKTQDNGLTKPFMLIFGNDCTK
jgi:hypothetical protein